MRPSTPHTVTIHKQIFNLQTTTPLDCLLDKDRTLPTHWEAIAKIIHSTQKESFHIQAPTGLDIANHPTECMCTIQQYPSKSKMVSPSKDEQYTTLYLHKCSQKSSTIIASKDLLKRTTIPNNILKAQPDIFHDILFLFFLQCYHHQQAIPTQWKHGTTIPLHKKDNPAIIINYRLIALACTIHKVFTSTLSTLLTMFREHHKILHHSQ